MGYQYIFLQRIEEKSFTEAIFTYFFWIFKYPSNKPSTNRKHITINMMPIIKLEH